MSNVLTGNPWVLDTASATPVSLARVKISGIRWIGATAAGHQVVVTDAGGGRIWSSMASRANYVEAYDPRSERLYTGLAIPTLDSGVLEIEFA